MFNLKQKNKNMHNIFNPKMCLKTILDSSWACNLESSESDKLPIQHIGGVPRLCFKYKDSVDSWLCGVIPFNKESWEAIDIRKYKDIKFTFYEESSISAKVSLVDNEENESNEINLSEVYGVKASEESEISLNIHNLFNNKFNPKKAKMIKFIGINKPHFYISNLYLN